MSVSPPTERPPSKGPSPFSLLESVPVTVTDGTTFVVRVLPNDDPAVPVALVLPAMALKAKFYLPLLTALRAAGLSAAACDLRGQGESAPLLGDGPDFGYKELIETDLPAVVAAVRERFPQAPLFLFGHSLGGQLALLFAAANPDAVDGVAVIGTGTVFWRAFGPRRWFEALWSIQWIGLVAAVRGSWPGGVLIPGAMAGGVMTDWARHSRTSRYRFRGRSLDYDAALRALTAPVLTIALDRDLLGPKSNVDFLGRRMPAARLTAWNVDEDSGVVHRDHFEWVKDSAVLAPAVAHWVRTGSLPS